MVLGKLPKLGLVTLQGNAQSCNLYMLNLIQLKKFENGIVESDKKDASYMKNQAILGFSYSSIQNRLN